MKSIFALLIFCSFSLASHAAPAQAGSVGNGEAVYRSATRVGDNVIIQNPALMIEGQKVSMLALDHSALVGANATPVLDRGQAGNEVDQDNDSATGFCKLLGYNTGTMTDRTRLKSDATVFSMHSNSQIDFFGQLKTSVNSNVIQAVAVTLVCLI